MVLGTILICGCHRGSADVSQANRPAADGSDLVSQTASKLQTAIDLHRRGLSQQALSVVQEVLIAAPDDSQALAIAVDVHASLGQFCEAADLATKIAEADQRTAMLIRAFDWHLRCGDFAAAESNLDRALELEPNNVQAHRLLAELLNAQGRRYEASDQVRQLIRLRDVGPNEILSLVDLSGPFLLVSYDAFTRQSQTSLFLLGKARRDHVANVKPQDVLALVRRVRENFPDSTAAAAFEGRLLAEMGRREEFTRWMKDLPVGVQQQPEYWRAIGDWLSLENRHPESIRAYGEALLRDPTDRQSLRGMIRSMDLVGNKEQTAQLRDRLAILDRIFRIAKDADAEQAGWISSQLQELTRPWEAAAWLMYAARLSGQLQQQIPELNRRHASIVAWEQGATAERIRQARLERMIGFSIERWPLPSRETLDTPTPPAASAEFNRELRFEDIADQVGIIAQFDSGFPLDGSDFFPHQVNGGGLAALDYDCDGRCDIYLVQSGGIPNDPFGSTPNQLFRQLPEQRFVEVTKPSMTGDRSFGQGVCGGDVNQDGFPDLLVANIGANVAYINQGDGTFRQADGLIAENVDRWTSSIGLGDLDGDHLPEIVEINYIDDPLVFQTKCRDDYATCKPQQFRKASDRILQCLADGTFQPWADTVSKLGQDPKLGFGLIIANFDRQYGNDFFVSNDGDLNHYWISTAASDAAGERFEMLESASVRGCSVGRDGDSQACMGIASGDFNRDGMLDLHVTNFYNEPVNLFMQTQSGFFSDEVLRYGLVEPSFGVLGFGTQAADFDNDGWLDIAVMNGHVFDARDEGIPFRMHPQLLRGSAQGFAAEQQASIGQYWQQQRLGRSLAMLDWNRDGRIDLLANHLDEPVSLLENESPSENWLQVELIGTESERDAIGAEVRVDSGGESWTGWQIGGDGYMCSNEPVIHFGLGQIKSIDRVEVRWPTGKTQTFADIQPNARYMIVEADEDPLRRWP